MSKRIRQERAEPIVVVTAGEVDPMSNLAKTAGIPLCGLHEPLAGSGHTCTRAAGHAEGHGRGLDANHPARHHVATGAGSIAKKVWQ